MVPRYNSQTRSDSNDPALWAMLVINRGDEETGWVLARFFSCMHTL
jgi:hypothetical protein